MRAAARTLARSWARADGEEVSPPPPWWWLALECEGVPMWCVWLRERPEVRVVVVVMVVVVVLGLSSCTAASMLASARTSLLSLLL